MVIPEKRPHPVIALLLILTGCYAVAFVGTQASFMGLQGWYQFLNKPFFTPPSWLFAPVWTILYALMGIAAWRVWRVPAGEAPSGSRTAALSLFVAQLFLNGMWSWLFFAWHLLFVAALEIVVLLIAVAATAWTFRKIDRPAAWMLVPYLAWVAFASALSIAIWRLNPPV